MTHAATVGALQLLDVIDALYGLGLGGRRLRTASGIDPRALRDPDARVPTATIVRLFAAAERLTGDPFVGLHAGQHARLRGPLSYLLMSSTSLAQGLRNVGKFSPLSLDTLRITVERHGSTASTIFDPGDRTFEGSHHAIDYLLMAAVRSIRLAVGRGYRLVEVHVRHRAPGAAAALARAFGCPARVGQRDDRIVHPLADLHATPQLANPRIAEQLEKFAEAQLARTAPHTTLRARVASVTRELLAAGQRPQSAIVARRLGLSERSLQRGLAEERTSFREARDAVQWKIVEALLSNPRLKVGAVALSVGFADVAAFSKAFKRWAGCPPAQYRDRIAARR